MKKILGLLLIGLSFISMANDEVTLESRYTIGDYTTATYSFMHLTRDNVNLTKNNWEILFEARRDFNDYFSVNTVVDDNSFIYDLGKRSCKSIKSTYSRGRNRRPLVWLAYSDADPSDLTPKKRVEVKTGHCYLAYNNDEDGRVVSLFNVKDHKENETVTINEIEVLNRLKAIY